MKKNTKRALIAVAALAVVFLVGPRAEINTQVKTFDLPPDLDQYLSESESRYPDIRPGAEKTIIWARADKSKTPLSIVYLHGFSATRQETAPLSDELAAELDANLFYTRLSGHGRSSEAMAEPTVNDWFNDAVEAFEIGKRLGDKVIVIGASTGGTLATWLAEQPDGDEVLAYILLSPNYAPRDSKAGILTWPWAEQVFVPLIQGPEYSFTPSSAAHAENWTHTYPSSALVTMMGMVKYVRESDLAGIEKPVLIIYSPNDTVVNSEQTEQIYEQIGSEIRSIQPVIDDQHEDNHVLAGDILAPNMTQKVKEIILNFISELE